MLIRSRRVVALGLLFALGGGLSGHAEERARLLAHATPEIQTSFDVFVPPAHSAELDRLLADQVTPGSAAYHQWLSPAAYRSRFGTSPAALAEVASELRLAGLEVTATGAHSVHAAGSVALVERAFATRLSHAVFPSGKTALVAETPLALPDALLRHNAVIPAFAASIHMRRHLRALGRVDPDNRSGADGPYWVTDLKQAYDLPDVRKLNGKGVTIGVLMSGGFNPADMKRYFAHEKLAEPSITEVPVAGGAPYSADTSTETHLDMQQAGGMAPGASMVLYNIPDLSDASIFGGIVTIVEDDAAEIVNMSFGAPEIAYTPNYNAGVSYLSILRAEDVLLRQGNAEGITFVASSGDAGALDGVPLACLQADVFGDCGYFGLSADYPATSPYVTSVGGTNLVTTSDTSHPTDLKSAYVGENAYYDRLESDIFFSTPAQGAIWGSGGGISLFEARPSFQSGVATGSTSHRTVPDVAGHMGGCPDGAITPCGPDRTSDVVAIAGAFEGVIGTSCSAPDFAGILALKAEYLKSRLGNENPDIYRLGISQRTHTEPWQIYRDHVPGNNGYYPATPGYNLVLGNGTVRGRAFIGVQDLPAAGTPLTASNP